MADDKMQINTEEQESSLESQAVESVENEEIESADNQEVVAETVQEEISQETEVKAEEVAAETVQEEISQETEVKVEEVVAEVEKVTKESEEKPLTNEEIKKRIYDKKLKRAFKTLRLRSLKNFAFWFTGAIMSFVLLFLALFVGVGVVPLGTYLGNNSNAVSSEISSKTLYNAVMSYNTYKIGDIPAITNAIDSLINDTGLDKYVEIDTEKMKDIKFVYSDGETDLMTELTSCIKVTATLDSVGASEMLGPVGELEIFSSWDEVKETDMPVTDDNGNITKDGENFTSNPKLYYYDANAVVPAGNSAMSTSKEPNYQRAFDDNGNRIAPIGAVLVYPNLSQIPVIEAFDVIGDSFARLEVASLLETFGVGEMSDGLLGSLLDDKTIADMGSITVDDILLSDILEAEEGDAINTILSSATGKPYNEISIGDLSGTNEDGSPKLDIDNIKLSAFLEAQEGDAINTILSSATGKDFADITISDLTGDGLNIDNIKLSAFLEAEDGDAINTILSSATGKDFAEITISDLTGDGLNIDNIKLSAFLEAEDGDAINTILSNATGIPYNEISIGDLSGTNEDGSPKLDIDNIKLSAFLKAEESDTIYKILTDATGKEDYNLITIADLVGTDKDCNPKLNIKNVAIGAFMEEDNEILKILVDVINSKRESDAQNGEFVKVDAKTLTIGDIETIDGIDNVKLTTFLPYYEVKGEKITDNKELYKTLLKIRGEYIDNLDDAEVKELAEDLYLSDLKLDMDEIKLTTFLPYYQDKDGKVTDNKMLYKILLQSSGKDIDGKSDAEIKSLANNLTLSDLKLDIKDMKLTTFLPYYENDNGNITNNKELYKTLLQANGKDLTGLNDDQIKELADDLTLTNLKFDIDNFKLTTFLPYYENDGGKITDNKKLYKILLQANGKDLTNLDDNGIKDLADGLTLKSLKFNVNNVKISTVINATPKLKDLLSGALAGKNYDEITLGDIGGENFDIDNVKLYSVFSASTQLKNILCGATGITNYNNIALKDLSSSTFNINNVKLSVVLSADEKLQNILSGALGGKAYNNITIGDLSSSTFNINNVKLSTVIDSLDGSLKSILEDVYVNHYVTVGNSSVLVNSYEDISIAMLASFKMEDLHLVKIMRNPSANLKNILEDAFDTDYEDITVSKIMGEFDYNKISLSTIIGTNPANPILNSLVKKNVSIGSIGSAIDSLSLYDVYGANVFTTTAISGAPRYSKNGNTYTLNSSGQYYLNKDAGIWLILCFNSSDIVQSGDDAGRATTYTVSNATINDLQGGAGTSFDVTAALMGATGRQLVDAGIVDSVSPLLYTHTMYEVFNPEVLNPTLPN